MELRPLYNPKQGTLRVVALMSGSGTNIIKLLEHRDRLFQKEGRLLFDVVAIFSDNAKSRAVQIGAEYDIPVIVRDIASFYKKRNAKRTDLKLREKFDRETVKILRVFKAKLACYGGYMSLATKPLINAFIGVNVHPADLSIEENGKRKWTGAHAVLDAISKGEKTLRSSTHLIEPECDMGKLFLISPPVPVKIPQGADLSNPESLKKIADQNQELLKQKGDWFILPKTVEEIARGNFQTDELGNFYYKGMPIPKGLKLESYLDI